MLHHILHELCLNMYKQDQRSQKLTPREPKVSKKTDNILICQVSKINPETSAIYKKKSYDIINVYWYIFSIVVGQLTD